MRRCSLFLPTFLLCTLYLQSPAHAAEKNSAGNVTESRALKEADTGENWLVNGGRFSGEHFSPLQQIHSKNIEDLGLAWAVTLPSPLGFQSEPIVVDGVVYLSGTLSLIWALDAKTGKVLWQFDPAVNPSINYGTSIQRYNRGVAVWEGAVYVGTADCRLIAIDAARGTKLWESPVCDSTEGAGAAITGAPRVGDGKVFMGYAASDVGARGALAAFDAKTGKQLWRFWTVPGNPAQGFESEALKRASETWPSGWAPYGGGAVWEGIRYDPVTGLVIFGTASTLPLNVKDRGRGDNLYTNAVIAVDAKTGNYRWHYQTVPEDAWDYDATMPKIITDLEWDGVKRRVVLEVPKNGFFYVLDAHSGKLLAADPYVQVNWASHVDLETGRPVVSAKARYYDDPEGRPVQVAPNALGSKNWQPMSYSPITGLVYLPVTNLATTFSANLAFGRNDWGAVETLPSGAGQLMAWDPIEREPRWIVNHPYPFNGGVLSTAGGLVFEGTAEGKFEAYSADTGKLLWSRETGSSISAAPVSYRLDDTQYILVAISRMGGTGLVANPYTSSPDARGPARVLAFKLGGEQPIPLPAPGTYNVPKPPTRTATSEQVRQGEILYSEQGCETCHGPKAHGPGARLVGGGIPDLRYAPPAVHDQWNEIVLDGARAQFGMQAYGLKGTESTEKSITFGASSGMTPAEAQAIRAYVLEQAWQAYDKEQAAKP